MKRWNKAWTIALYVFGGLYIAFGLVSIPAGRCDWGMSIGFGGMCITCANYRREVDRLTRQRNNIRHVAICLYKGYHGIETEETK